MTSDVFSVITVLFSGLSVVVSVVAILVSIDVAKKNEKLQKRLVYVEETREKERIEQSRTAYLLPQRFKANKMGTLRIENRGDAEARNIEVIINNKPLSLWEEFIDKEINPISAHSNCEFKFRWNQGEISNSWKVSISWTDDSGKPGMYQGNLNSFIER
jgi:hypothetical protein